MVIYCFLIVVVNVLTDVAYGVLDPRVHASHEGAHLRTAASWVAAHPTTGIGTSCCASLIVIGGARCAVLGPHRSNWTRTSSTA